MAQVTVFPCPGSVMERMIVLMVRMSPLVLSSTPAVMESSGNGIWKKGHSLRSRIKNALFRCSDGNCIPVIWQCDGEPECSDGLDEWPDLCSMCKTLIN